MNEASHAGCRFAGRRDFSAFGGSLGSGTLPVEEVANLHARWIFASIVDLYHLSF